MKKFSIGALTALAIMAVSAGAAAEEHPFRLGVGLDIGVPSGAGLQLTLHPKEDWARVGLAADYNYLGFGGRGSLELDPMALINIRHEGMVAGNIQTWHERDFPFGLFVDVQGGFFSQAGIPGHSDLPQVGYDYLNLYGGLRFGSPKGFHWNFLIGPTYMHISTGNFQSVLNNTGVSGLKVGNPTVDGWVTPTFETGFEIPITL